MKEVIGSANAEFGWMPSLENPAPGHTDDSYTFEDDPTSIREHGKMNTLTMKRIVGEVVQNCT